MIATPGQTVGPFFGFALPYDGDRELVAPGTPGSLRLGGRVFDGAGEPVPDALLELWQSDPSGAVVQRPGSLRRDGFESTGWGRCATDPSGTWSFSTLAPGAGWWALTLFARGLMHRLQTRVYLPDVDPETDPLLAGLGAERRATLITAADEYGYTIDLRLQGEGETVFLDHTPH